MWLNIMGGNFQLMNDKGVGVVDTKHLAMVSMQ